MKSFRFRLESVLRYRTTLATIEEGKLALSRKQLDEATQNLEALRRSNRSIEQEVLSAQSVTGADLKALGAWQLEMKRQTQSSLQAVEEARIAFQQQMETVRLARRQVRLLEKLRQRRLEEWQEGFDRELEELAASSFLSRWSYD